MFGVEVYVYTFCQDDEKLKDVDVIERKSSKSVSRDSRAETSLFERLKEEDQQHKPRTSSRRRFIWTFNSRDTRFINSSSSSSSFNLIIIYFNTLFVKINLFCQNCHLKLLLLDMADPFQLLFEVLTNQDQEQSRSSEDFSEGLPDNVANIANGSMFSASPDEEIIKCRGRKQASKLKVNKVSSRRDQMLLALATRKSPRKPTGPVVDYASYFFRSPTPKKTPQLSGMTPKKEPSPALLKARRNFRKRLSLNSESSSPVASPVSGTDLSQPKKSCLRKTATLKESASTEKMETTSREQL